MKNINPKNGFALLYAVLLTGIILTIGLGLSAIIAKQIVLSSTGAASQAAYYAANTGKECILNWGINGGRDENGLFLTAFGGYVVDPESGENVYYPIDEDELLGHIVCGGENIDVNPNIESDSVTFNLEEFGINFDGQEVCVKTDVFLYPDKPSQVVSTGYNLPCSETGNPRRVEREIIGFGSFAAPF